MPHRGWTRREALEALAAGALLWPAPAFASRQQDQMLARPIPSTGETLPAVGLGTWQTFDVGTSAEERRDVRAVLRLFVQHGGALVDSSPMYARAEGVVGSLATELGVVQDLFHATKVWTRGRGEGMRQMEQSFDRMRVQTMDLMQIHNLVDWRTHLATLREWKARGRIRYIGITHYVVDAFDELEQIIGSEDLDFVQLNFSIATRAAERRMLPYAAERGVAVIVNRPYESGALFRQTRGHELPDWAEEFDCTTWGQFFLKYILSEPHVTCVIPATSDPRHVVDNMRAGYGRMPDAAMRQRMVRHLERL